MTPDPHLDTLTENLDFFAPDTWQHRYYAALREKYDKNVDLGWEPALAMARARKEVAHYGEVL